MSKYQSKEDVLAEMWITLGFAIPVILSVIGIAYMPYEINWFINQDLEPPAWISYVWWGSAAVVIAINFRHAQPGNPIGSLIVVLFGPYTLACLGLVWVFKKLGWYKP